MLTFGELFAGIGGFSLGLERAGMKCKWQVEIDPYATAVLKKHWPEVPKHDDVRTFPPQGDYAVDLICGGFPCQDISVAGKGAGLAGARSGLWYEFARIIGVVRPRYVVVENVAALLNRGMGTVLGDLSSLGYDAEWHVIPASAVGAPHRRDRVWIVANARREHGDRWPSVSTLPDRQKAQRDEAVNHSERCGALVANAEGISCRARLCEDDPQQDGHQPCNSCGDVSNANRAGCQQQRRAEPAPAEQLAAECGGWWSVEPDVGRVAHGVPSRVDRLRCLGNAVVPQVVEVIGRAIIAHEERLNK
jgi:DNA (cytosine-5)-methyltransferase 1